KSRLVREVVTDVRSRRAVAAAPVVPDEAASAGEVVLPGSVVRARRREPRRKIGKPAVDKDQGLAHPSLLVVDRAIVDGRLRHWAAPRSWRTPMLLVCSPLVWSAVGQTTDRAPGTVHWAVGQ